jgi:serine/threonine-protein kinase
VNGCDLCLEVLEGMQRKDQAEIHLLAGLIVTPPDDAVSHLATNGTAPSGTPEGENLNGHARAVAPECSGSDQSDWPAFPGYEIIARVGSGGMGEIYRARHCATNRIVALKTLPPARGQDTPAYKERLVRFRIEIEAISRLQHPNIVAIYDVGNQDDRPYYTMEWIGGGSLAEKLSGMPQEERRAAQWLATLSRAVSHVHEHGIIHRDLKPGNILLVSSGVSVESVGDNNRASTAHRAPRTTHQLKIADFGVARLTDRTDGTTRAEQWLGTPEYMAPEQAATDPSATTLGPATDVYALGVLLYEMLTGRPPFRAHEPLETLRQVREEEPIMPRRLRPKISRDLETICLKCLNKDPARRYPSAKQLCDDLERWLDGRPILARPAGRLERTVKWARRHPERALISALAAAAALLLVVAYGWQLWSENARYARHLADSADCQFLLVKYAVRQTAEDTELRDLLRGPENNQPRLRAYLVKTKDTFVRWFTRPGENVPIINWFVMDPQGTIVADSSADPNSVGKNYSFRDYFRGGIQSRMLGDQGGVYISRVYESEQDDRFKFTAITKIVGPGKLYGLLGASLAVDSKLVALDMKKEPTGAMIVGPTDPNTRLSDQKPARELPPFVVVLHRDYDLPGQKPKSVSSRQLTCLNLLASEPARHEVSDRLAGEGSFMHYARVGDSGFVVMVERPYPWPIGLLLRAPGWVWPVLPSGAFALAVLWKRSRRSSRDSPAPVESSG